MAGTNLMEEVLLLKDKTVCTARLKCSLTFHFPEVFNILENDPLSSKPNTHTINGKSLAPKASNGHGS